MFWFPAKNHKINIHFPCTIYEICQTYTTYYKENKIMIFIIYFSLYIVLLTYWYKALFAKNIQLDNKTFQTTIKSRVYNSVKSNTQKQVITFPLLRKFTYSANASTRQQSWQKIHLRAVFLIFIRDASFISLEYTS